MKATVPSPPPAPVALKHEVRTPASADSSDASQAPQLPHGKLPQPPLMFPGHFERPNPFVPRTAQPLPKTGIILPHLHAMQSARRFLTQSLLPRTKLPQTPGIAPIRCGAMSAHEPTSPSKYSRMLKNFGSGFDPRDMKNLHNLSGEFGCAPRAAVYCSRFRACELCTISESALL